jgi:hypothetical protein
MNEPTSDEPGRPPNLEDIDDDRRYTTREAGKLLQLHWRTIVAYVYNGKLTAEREDERRGPVYYLRGAEIKRFQRERQPLGYPRKKKSENAT